MSKTPSTAADVTTNVAIVGGGICGLTLQIALQQRGVTADVFEQADELVEIGAGIGLFANSLRLLRRLGLYEALESNAAEPVDMVYRDSVTGEVIAATPMGRDGAYRSAFGEPYLCMHRRHLQDTLAASVEEERLHLGERLADLAVADDRVVLKFESGLVADADVVVGADGARSVVRRWVTGADNAAYSGSSGFRGIARAADVPSLDHPESTLFWLGAGQHVVQFPIDPGSDSVTFLAAIDSPSSWDVDGDWRIPATTQEAVDTFAGWHPAVTELLGAVEHTERWGLFVVETLDRWSRGPVVIVGDAAHAMLPHHGQGANQAIEDAVVLAELLALADGQGRAAAEHALHVYEEARKPRGERVQKLCWDTNELLHVPRDQWADRNAGLSGLHKLAWLHEHDAQERPTRA